MTQLHFALIVELYQKLDVKSDLVREEFFSEALKDEPRMKELLVSLLTSNQGIKDEAGQ